MTIRLCRYCACPIVLIGPAGWGSIRGIWYPPDLRCDSRLAPGGHHRVLVLSEMLSDIASVYHAL